VDNSVSLGCGFQAKGHLGTADDPAKIAAQALLRGVAVGRARDGSSTRPVIGVLPVTRQQASASVSFAAFLGKSCARLEMCAMHVLSLLEVCVQLRCEQVAR
jgi:hypothetical protein